jgi:hypothetical protein
MNDRKTNRVNSLKQDEGAGFVEVAYAKTLSEAVGCRNWLLERSIPARMENPAEALARSGIAVLVPAGALVPALEALAGRPDEEEEEFEDDDFNDEDEEYDDDYGEEDDFDEEDDEDDFEEEEEEEEEFEDDDAV